MCDIESNESSGNNEPRDYFPTLSLFWYSYAKVWSKKIYEKRRIAVVLPHVVVHIIEFPDISDIFASVL